MARWVLALQWQKGYLQFLWFIKLIPDLLKLQSRN